MKSTGAKSVALEKFFSLARQIKTLLQSSKTQKKIDALAIWFHVFESNKCLQYTFPPKKKI